VFFGVKPRFRHDGALMGSTACDLLFLPISVAFLSIMKGVFIIIIRVRWSWDVDGSGFLNTTTTVVNPQRSVRDPLSIIPGPSERLGV